MAQKKNFDQPDSRVEFGGVIRELVEIGDYTVGRAIRPPGWRWSTHIQPLVGGKWCMARHIGVVISGREATLFPDGVSSKPVHAMSTTSRRATTAG
jgi:hypothetical protein